MPLSMEGCANSKPEARSFLEERLESVFVLLCSKTSTFVLEKQVNIGFTWALRAAPPRAFPAPSARRAAALPPRGTARGWAVRSRGRELS